MRVSSLARWRGVSLLGVLAIALSMLVLGAEPASAAVSGVSSTTTTAVQAGATATLAGVSVTSDAGLQVVVNLSTTEGTLAVDTSTGITLSYGYSASGTELAFTGTEAQVNSALAALTLTTSAADEGSSATVTITARDVDTLTYSSETGHYYKYVAASGISWSAAQSAATGSYYRGQQGYLATVPSAGVNNLIASKIPGATNVWLGGRGDLDVVPYGRVWSWVDGPRAGQAFSRCTASGENVACDFVDSSSFYYAWSDGEPNNWTGGEPYIVTNWGSANGLWNDLKDASTGTSGYVVEYGDLLVGATSWTGVYSGSSSVSIVAVPGAPTAVSASPGEGQATVSFSAPSWDGGSAIDAYRVTMNPGNVQTECSSPCTFTGLTVGQPYSFVVQAHNANGWSAASSTASATPGVRPGTPSGAPTLMIVGASPSASVSAPGYPAPTYTVTSGALPAGVTLNATSGVLGGAPTVTGAFSFGVTATNAFGTAAATFTGDIESVPTISTSSLGTLRWNTAYDAMLSASAVPTAAWAVTGGTLPAGLSLESDGQLHGTPTTVGSYSVQITATNSHGSDAYTFAGDVDPLPATAPTVTGLAPDDKSLTLQFTGPTSTGGSTVTGYEYSINAGGTWLAGEAGLVASPLSITGLTNGTFYSVLLRAVTAAGGGAPSTAATGTPRTVPSAPTSVTATAGEHQATVSFGVPASDGGDAIDEYRVTTSPGNTQTTCTSPCTVTGLTSGQAYSFTVQARNAAGWSSASSAASTTPGVRPGTPTGSPTLLIVGASPSGTVSATGYPAPSFSVTAGALPAGVTLDSATGALGGSATTTGVFLFQVTASNTHGSAAATFMGSVESVPSITTSSLGTLRWGTAYDSTLSASAVPTATWSVTDGPLPTGLSLESDGQLHGSPTAVGAYSVEVTATNSHGSDATTFTGTVDAIPATAPAIMHVTPDDSSLTFEFTAPTSTGGAVITGYEYSTDDGTSWQAGPFGVASSPFTVSGLANGTDYSIKLRAVTVAGGGAASDSATGTPRTTAGAPTSVTATAGERAATVSFGAPASDGGDAIDEYRVTASPGDTQTTCTSPCTITGLTSGQSYNFTVQAHNAAGWSSVSSAASATPGTSPGIPAGLPSLLIVGASPSATVTATGYPAPSFSVTAGALPSGVTLDSTTGALGGSAITTGMFLFQVTASNVHGDASATFMGGVESVPLITTSSLGTLRWGTAYDTTQSASAVPIATWSVTDGALPAGLTLEDDGQVHGSPTAVGAYSVEITATNFNGADAKTFAGTVDAIPAIAPTITKVTPDDTTLTFEFTAPTSTGGAVVTGYEYSFDGGTSWQAGPFGVVASPLTVSGLANGTDYSVKLRAVTVVGGGEASGSADGTPRTVADAPTVDGVTAGDHSLVLEFTPPVDDGGSGIVGYRYSVDGGSTWSTSVEETTTPLFTIYGLENGQSYEVALRAVSDAGDGVASPATSGAPVAAPVAMPGETDPPELQLGIGDGSENGIAATVTSGAARAGWSVTTPSVSLTLEAYDSHAKLVAGGGGTAYFEGYIGGYVKVSGEGFKPGSTADVWIFSSPVKLGSLTVASDGTFAGKLHLPALLAIGAHTVQINGVTAAGQTASTSLGVRLGNAPGGLATTGGIVGWALAAQLICAGLALVIVGRRRSKVSS